jgi:thioredoxin reductase (NADPH)
VTNSSIAKPNFLKKAKKYDIVIIGGGPAGMSAALWSSSLGLSSVLIEKENRLSGQLSIIHNAIRNYIGIATANGEELRRHFFRSLEEARFDALISKRVSEIDLEKRTIEVSDGTLLEAGAIIIASGVRRRRLGVEGEDEFVGKGILTSGAREAAKVKGKQVVIVGGGDAAIENALILAEHARSVTVFHRRSEFKARPEFIEQVKIHPKVVLLPGHVIESFRGRDRLELALVHNLNNNSKSEIGCDFALIRIGVQPNSELFQTHLEVDSEGYIKVDSNRCTNTENVYAIGDVANPHALNIATAAGNAATAVTYIMHSKQSSRTHPRI